MENTINADFYSTLLSVHCANLRKLLLDAARAGTGNVSVALANEIGEERNAVKTIAQQLGQQPPSIAYEEPSAIDQDLKSQESILSRLLGRRLANYTVESIIGLGSFGVVYKESQSHLHRHVALKVLPAAFPTQLLFADRFKQEMRALASFKHPNIVEVYDAGAMPALQLFQS